MASGMSAAIVSRIGLPLSHVSAWASNSSLSSMRWAIFIRIFERSAGEVFAHLSFAAWAASSAALTSFSSERAISQSLPPVTGVMLSKYLPSIGSRHSPPMKLPYFNLNRRFDDLLMQHVILPR